MNINSSKSTYCWDSCVIIAWFKEEQDKPLEDMRLVIEAIEADRANLLLSMTTYSEVLCAGKSVDAAGAFRKFLQRSNVTVADVTFEVAKEAARIREDRINANGNLKTPDAQVLATAIVYHADVLHTFDDRLQKLSGTTTAKGLKICEPLLLSGQRALAVIAAQPSVSRQRSNNNPHMSSILYGDGAHVRWGKVCSSMTQLESRVWQNASNTTK